MINIDVNIDDMDQDTVVTQGPDHQLTVIQRHLAQALLHSNQRVGDEEDHALDHVQDRHKVCSYCAQHVISKICINN